MSAPAVASARAETLLTRLIATGGSEMAGRIAQLLTLAMAGWTLGVADLGVIGVAWSLTAIAMGVVQGGPDQIGTQRLAVADGESAAQTIADTTGLKIVLVSAVVPVLVLVQLALGHGDASAMAQLAVQICSMAGVSLGYAWALRGLCRFFEQGVIRLVQAVANVAVLGLLLSVWRSPLAVPAAEAIAAVLAIAMVRHRLGSLARLSSLSCARLRHMAGPALLLGVAGGLATVTWQMPVLAAARWASIEQVSYLSIVFRLLIGLQCFLYIALQAVFPSLAQALATDTARGRDMTFALTLQMSAVTLVGVVFLAGTGNVLVPLFLGPQFTEAGPLFRWLVPALLPVTISGTVTYALIAQGEAKAVAYIAAVTGVASTLTCALAFWLVPTVWAALVFHPVLWGQAGLTVLVGWRRGVVAYPQTAWGVLLNPLVLSQWIRKGRTSAPSDPAPKPVE